MVAAQENVWVVRGDDGFWTVRRAGESRHMRRMRTQADALAVGQELARNEGVDLIVKGHDGVIRLPGDQLNGNGRS